MDAIDRGQFHKVVPARSYRHQLLADFNPITFFDQLCEAYPSAMTSLVSLPQTGTWIGATPESLLNIDRQGYFSTSALAGTQIHKNNMSLKDAAWTQKEIEEQAMVSRYIINCFKKIRLREFEEIGPRTIRAGNLIHLETRYKVNLEEVHYPLLGSVMLELLHPTSAVCGLPKQPAMDFLEQHESIERAYFTGYLGPVNIDEEINIFVNLRCMQLVENNGGVFYSGAGVTANSNPEKEWIETTLKMKTLLEVIS
jgi:isochorismate synthase